MAANATALRDHDSSLALIFRDVWSPPPSAAPIMPDSTTSQAKPKTLSKSMA